MEDNQEGDKDARDGYETDAITDYGSTFEADSEYEAEGAVTSLQDVLEDSKFSSSSSQQATSPMVRKCRTNFDQLCPVHNAEFLVYFILFQSCS
jgi:hypothetical protein